MTAFDRGDVGVAAAGAGAFGGVGEAPTALAAGEAPAGVGHRPFHESACQGPISTEFSALQVHEIHSNKAKARSSLGTRSHSFESSDRT